jgi:hypothetical protein
MDDHHAGKWPGSVRESQVRGVEGFLEDGRATVTLFVGLTTGGRGGLVAESGYGLAAMALTSAGPPGARSPA